MTGSGGSLPARQARLRGIFFDVGNTLITPARPIPDIYAEVFGEFGATVTGPELVPIFRRVWEEIARRVPAGQDRYRAFPGGERAFWLDFVRRVVEAGELGIDPVAPFEILFERFRSRAEWRVFDEVPEVLAALRERGWRMGIVSNWDRRLSRLLADLALDRYFEPIVISAVEGIEKPDARIFHLAAQRIGLDPRACVHVGDSVSFDIGGARAAGMHGVLVRRWDEESPTDFRRLEPDSVEVPVVRDLVGVADLVADPAACDG